MNGGPKNVAPETRARVLEAARALGYVPNAAARSLKRGITNMLGLVAIDTRNPFFAELTHAIEQESQRRGYSVLISTFDQSQTSLAALVTGMAARQVDGIMITAPLGIAEIAQVWALDIPTVLLNQFVPMEGFRTIGSQYYTGAMDAVKHLVDHGKTRIAFVGGKDPRDERRRGWIDALNVAGLRRSSEHDVDFSLQGGYEAGVQISELEAKPDAVFISSDQQAMGFLAATQSRGVRVPEDLAVVSFDGSPEGAYYRPSLTSVGQSVTKMAKSAVETILDPHAASGDQRFATTLIIRESCGCL